MNEQDFDITLAIEAVRAGLEQIEMCEEIADITVMDATIAYYLQDGESFVISVSPSEIAICSVFESSEEEIIRCSPKEFVDELDYIIARLLQDIDGIDRVLQDYEMELSGGEGEAEAEDHLMKVLGFEKNELGEIEAIEFEGSDEWAGTTWGHEDKSEEGMEHWS